MFPPNGEEEMTIQWSTPGLASVLCDGAYGSTGKGLFAAYLAQFTDHVDIATCDSGANAGHTTQSLDGRKYVCFHLPTTGVERPESTVYINAGSIIDPVSFQAEIEQTGIDPKRVFVHPRAAVILPEDTAAEHDPNSSTAKLASTQKGVGAALVNKIMRRSKLAEGHWELMPVGIRIGTMELNSHLRAGKSIVVEVPQGLGLSLNHGYAYPYTTSRDCWVGSGLNDAGIHPRFLGPVCMTLRTFPIRVGNLFNLAGEQIGTSGPFYPDSQELNWNKDFPNIEPERTTVTKRVRRIATWSDEQYRFGLVMNQPTIVGLNFCNYLKSGDELQKLRVRMMAAHHKVGLSPQILYGFGPNTEDVVDNFDEAYAWYDRK
jgi:adenylosuccinate synthase